MNNINELQNSKGILKALFAQRYLYSRAKKYEASIFILIIVNCLIANLFITYIDEKYVLICAMIILIVSIILEKIKEKEDNWNIENFSELFAIKVLQTAGRAITQSRYFKWDSVVKQKEYLLSIRYDDMFQDNIKYISKIKKYLQIDHYFLLNLLQNRCTYLICFLLKLKNSISHS